MVSSSGKPELAGDAGRDLAAPDGGSTLGATGPAEVLPDPDVEARERRIREIVLVAAACEPDEKETFLRQVAVTDPNLLEEARRRLHQAVEPPSAFLAIPAAEILDPANPVAKPDGATTLRVPPSGQTLPFRTVGSGGTASGAERYEVGECLGLGGMSRVFRAFDRQLERPVALKLLERADPGTLDSSLREAQLQAKVRHEYVLEVYETGNLDGQPFIAMYYVDGPTLMDVRDDTSLEQKVRLMAQVAEGLHAAHREGLIHRDVKPSNVLVEKTAEGRLKPRVADFGIATGLSGGSSIWTATLAGTPYYIAPERLHDEARPVDCRSDVYSLGVTIYQLLTGELPFHHPSLAETLRQAREDPPPKLRDRSPTVPAELEAIVLKCLAKEPDARYPTAQALADDLWRFIDGKPVEAHAATFTYRLARSAAYGRSLPTGALIAGVLLITLLALFAAWTSTQAKRVAFEAKQAKLAAYEAEVVLDGLANAYHEQGRYADAESLYRRVLEIREQRLGLEHPDTRELLGRLAFLYESSGQVDKAGEARALLGSD